jgi:hypothetical protein
MKWREPEIKGMLTPKNVLAVFILILVVSIPFGYLGGNGKFHISVCLLAFGFMALASTGFLISPFLPSTLVQLKEDMIVRGPRGTSSQRSAYKDIDCIYFYRDCSYSWDGNQLIVNAHQGNVEGPHFTRFEVVMKNDVFVDGIRQFSTASLRSVQNFAVPEYVNLEQVLQILRDKGVKVNEGPLAP